MHTFADILLVAAVVGTGVVAGVFFAFSGFVVQGFDRLSPAHAARAMREINITAVRAPLMLAIFATALLVAILLVFALLGEPHGGTQWAIIGAALYLVGVIGVTGGANVPRNNRLAAVAETDDAALAAAWLAFRPGWAAWNHVRTLSSTASSLCLIFAFITSHGGFR
ncbi:DUF1772 domain-containing protein [Streptomyces sp. ISL-90]|nr:DUF1772 domain-containing protein [Streptomyces sp. ISL-90]